MRPTVAAGAAAKLLAALEHHGLDPVEPCRRAGLDRGPWEQLDARILLSELERLWTEVMRVHRRPELPLWVAEEFRPSDYQLFGFVAMTCSTLGEALEQIQRYVPLWIEGARWTRPTERSMAYQLALADSLGARCIIESALAELVHAGRLASGGSFAAAVELPHPGPPSLEAHRAWFGGTVTVGRPQALVEVTSEVLCRPLLQADPGLAAYLRQRAEEVLAARGGALGLVARLQSAVLAELARGPPSFAAVAKRMGMSARTLRRRLEEEGTTFRDLVDVVRKEAALDHLRQQTLALAEVAFVLGFSDPSAFHRAFKRWTGTTPAEYRLRHR
jgi:AraC-like DNA-binding protein